MQISRGVSLDKNDSIYQSKYFWIVRPRHEILDPNLKRIWVLNRSNNQKIFDIWDFFISFDRTEIKEQTVLVWTASNFKWTCQFKRENMQNTFSEPGKPCWVPLIVLFYDAVVIFRPSHHLNFWNSKLKNIELPLGEIPWFRHFLCRRQLGSPGTAKLDRV